MVSKFNTGELAVDGNSPSGSGGGKTLLVICGLILSAYLAYKFVYLPYKEKKEKESLQNAS